jgi:hypothetical protein
MPGARLADDELCETLPFVERLIRRITPTSNYYRYVRFPRRKGMYTGTRYMVGSIEDRIHTYEYTHTPNESNYVGTKTPMKRI